jgi:hypothetical protein
MKAYRGEKMYYSTIISEADAEQWLTSWTGPCNLRTGPLNRVLGGFQSWSGHFGIEKNLFSPLGIEPCTIQLVEQTLY